MEIVVFIFLIAAGNGGVGGWGEGDWLLGALWREMERSQDSHEFFVINSYIVFLPNKYGNTFNTMEVVQGWAIMICARFDSYLKCSYSVQNQNHLSNLVCLFYKSGV